MLHHPEIMRMVVDDHVQSLRRAARRPVPAGQAETATEIELRLCRADDDAALERLAQLDGRTVPGGRLLLALVGGRVVAALPLAGGALLADPFTRTSELRPLLELRAAQLRPRRRLSLRHA